MDTYLNNILSLITGEIARDIALENGNTRTIWAHKYLQDRDETHAGAWCVLKEMIVDDPVAFSKYVRMSHAHLYGWQIL